MLINNDQHNVQHLTCRVYPIGHKGTAHLLRPSQALMVGGAFMAYEYTLQKVDLGQRGSC
jgi:hypothetical protein